MTKIASSPRFIYAILAMLGAVFTCGAVSHLLKGTSSVQTWTGISVAYGLVLFLYLYIKSMNIIIDQEKLSYRTLFERQEIFFRDLQNVEVHYLHHNVQTPFPVLHLISVEKTIEIPWMMFEKDIEYIYELLKQ
ncbi:MAG: hypothetical protein ACE3JN_02725 [Ectobacillus sp.]